MEKILFCNLDLLKISFSNYNNSSQKANRDDFLAFAKSLCANSENHMYFISRDQKLLDTAEEQFVRQLGYTEFKFCLRETARDFVMQHKHHNNLFVFISGKDVDFHMAVHTRSLFIIPTWIPAEESALKYGVKVGTPVQLFKFISALNNHENWYARADIEPNIIAMSLMDARSKIGAITQNERDMIEHFEQLLKFGNSKNYYDILLYHFLAGMTNSRLFDDIELFGMIPSSDCTWNPYIFNFMHQTRMIKGKQIPRNLTYGENLLLRTNPKQKAHLSYPSHLRAQMGATEEFKTICINPDFKNKINTLRKNGNLNVCIFDDYMTHGNSFNAVRNLLKYLGANKIIFVSLGNFGRPFQKWDYDINGDVYSIGYSYTLTNTTQIPFSFNSFAKEEVDVLYDIFNL